MNIVSRKEAKLQGLKTYFTNKSCKHGHVSERRVGCCGCVECEKERNKVYREANPERVKEYSKVWREDNPDYNKVWREDNPDYYKEHGKVYREANPERVKEYKKSWLTSNPDYYNDLYANDPNYKLNKTMRNHLKRVLKALSTAKSGRTNDLLGYSADELMNHIEKYFLEGMSWDNYGTGWHIDHSYSVAQSIKDGVTDPAIINALSNLRPMWSEHNMNKKDQDFETWIEANPQYHDMYAHWLELESID